MKLLVLSTSLNPGSKSRLLAAAASTALTTENVDHSNLDIKDLPLPLCDGGAAYGDQNTAKAGEIVKAAEGVIVASPISNYNANATF